MRVWTSMSYSRVPAGILTNIRHTIDNGYTVWYDVATGDTVYEC